MRLCHDFYQSENIHVMANMFNKSETEDLVNLYKGRSIATGFSASNNYEQSRIFAINGFEGNQSVPFGDKTGCHPSCPIPYRGSPFTIRWVNRNTPGVVDQTRDQLRESRGRP